MDKDLRAEVASDGSLGARIRDHRLVPYQAIIGAAEAASGEVSLRLRDGRKLPSQPAPEFLSRLRAQVAARTPELWPEWQPSPYGVGGSWVGQLADRDRSGDPRPPVLLAGFGQQVNRVVVSYSRCSASGSPISTPVR